MLQCLTREQLFGLFICFGKAVQDETLVPARVGRQLILQHLHQLLLVQDT